MSYKVTIDRQSVSLLNEIVQTAEIIVDLSKVWNEIVSQYTHFYAIGELEVPILEWDALGHPIQKNMQLKLTQVFKVKEVRQEQVILKTNYSNLVQEDDTRAPQAKVELIVYSVKEEELDAGSKST